MHIDTTIQSPNHSPRPAPAVITMLVIHATAGSAASALSWLCNPRSRVSAHYLIDKGGHTWRLVPDARMAWHAGKSTWQGQADCNRVSLGIELENDNTGRDPYPEPQYQACLALSRALVIRYGIVRSCVVRHLDIAPGRKTDPAGFAWNRLLAELYPGTASGARYRARARSYIRRLPHTHAAHVDTLKRGDEVLVRRLIEGQYHANTWGQGTLWAETPAGYVWLPQLEAV